MVGILPALMRLPIASATSAKEACGPSSSCTWLGLGLG
jgi:hypothetical protein